MERNTIPLREVRVRTVRPDEELRFDTLMREHHYLGFRKYCGHRLRQVAVHGERWLALLGWHAAALHCAARDRWIGWTSLQRRQRLFLVCNQSRFLILPEASGIACLASRVLGRSVRHLRHEWPRQHGHPLLLAETFVDPSRFAGTCYRAANWIQVGSTRGFGRTRGAAIGYVEHHLPKRVFVYPLHKGARRQLAGEQANPDWRPFRQRIMLTPSQWSSLREFLSQVTDPRSPQGLRYPMPVALTLLIAARLAGAKTLTELCDFGRALDQDVLARIGSRLRPQSGRYEASGISSWHYILKRIDEEEVERLLAAWSARNLPSREREAGPDEQPQAGLSIALDGKTMRGSYDRDLGQDGKLRNERAQQQVSAVDIGSRMVVGQRGFTGKKEDAEGLALRELIDTLNLKGACYVADALHTNRETAQHIINQGCHYLLTVKGNQPKLHEQLAEYFSGMGPDVVDWDSGHGRIECRQIVRSGDIGRCPQWLDFPGARFVAKVTRDAKYKKTGEKRKTEIVYLVTSLPPEQASSERLLELNRGYWGAVENGVHRVRDGALREDASRLRKGALPRVMAAFANLALSILRKLGVENIQRRMNQFRLAPNSVFACLGACPG